MATTNLFEAIKDHRLAKSDICPCFYHWTLSWWTYSLCNYHFILNNGVTPFLWDVFIPVCVPVVPPGGIFLTTFLWPLLGSNAQHFGTNHLAHILVNALMAEPSQYNYKRYAVRLLRGLKVHSMFSKQIAHVEWHLRYLCSGPETCR